MIEKKQIFFFVFLDLIFATAGILLLLLLLQPLVTPEPEKRFDIVIFAEGQFFQWHSFSYQQQQARQTTISLADLAGQISAWLREEERIPKILWLLKKEDLDWQYRISQLLQKTVAEQHHPQTPFHYELTFWPVISIDDQQQRLKNWYEKQHP